MRDHPCMSPPHVPHCGTPLGDPAVETPWGDHHVLPSLLDLPSVSPLEDQTSGTTPVGQTRDCSLRTPVGSHLWTPPGEPPEERPLGRTHSRDHIAGKPPVPHRRNPPVDLIWGTQFADHTWDPVGGPHTVNQPGVQPLADPFVDNSRGHPWEDPHWVSPNGTP